MINSKFKPCLLPNDKVGERVDWAKRISNPKEWIASVKLNGIRIEIADGVAYSRSLKKFKSKWVQQKANDVSSLSENIILEGEIFGIGMNLEEIKHFVTSVDVTSEASISKLKADKRRGKWRFPGRSIEWLTTYPKELKVYLFDYWHEDTKLNKQVRVEYVSELIKDNRNNGFLDIAPYFEFKSINELLEIYEDIIDDKGEGLVIYRKRSIYKNNRYTLHQNQGYKIKDNAIPYEGMILDIIEGTVVDEYSERGLNELGYSTTSKRKEDRVPSGMAKGFYVVTTDGKKLIVSLKNTNNSAKVELLKNKDLYLGCEIEFMGMAPSKEGGVPSQAFYNMNNFVWQQ